MYDENSDQECADAWADIGLHWVYVTVVGVDVLRLILQSIFLHRKCIYKKLFVTILKSLSFALVKFHSDRLYH